MDRYGIAKSTQINARWVGGSLKESKLVLLVVKSRAAAQRGNNRNNRKFCGVKAVAVPVIWRQIIRTHRQTRMRSETDSRTTTKLLMESQVSAISKVQNLILPSSGQDEILL